jgi:hypothetical protein
VQDIEGIEMKESDVSDEDQFGVVNEEEFLMKQAN